MKPADRDITTPYGKKGSAWATGEHGGADYGCPTGDPVYAMWGGTITGASWGSAYGTQLVIDHDHLPDGSPGLWAVYAHLKSKVRTSGRVEAGELIGYSGATGNVSGPHLHVEVQRAANWQQGNYTNPQPWIDAGGSMDVYNYVYSGKSEDTKELPLNEYTWVTKDTDDPSASGLEFKLIYLNVKLRWAREGFGNIRVKFIREGGDDTAYQDYLVHSSQPDFLITHMHMEAGEKGIGGKWHIKITGDALASAAVDTRFNKYATIKDG